MLFKVENRAKIANFDQKMAAKSPKIIKSKIGKNCLDILGHRTFWPTYRKIHWTSPEIQLLTDDGRTDGRTTDGRTDAGRNITTTPHQNPTMSILTHQSASCYRNYSRILYSATFRIFFLASVVVGRWIILVLWWNIDNKPVSFCVSDVGRKNIWGFFWWVTQQNMPVSCHLSSMASSKKFNLSWPYLLFIVQFQDNNAF